MARDSESKIKTEESYVLEPVGYERLQRTMAWEGLRYGNPDHPRYCTGEVLAPPEFPWQRYSQSGGDKQNQARGLRIGKQGK